MLELLACDPEWKADEEFRDAVNRVNAVLPSQNHLPHVQEQLSSNYAILKERIAFARPNRLVTPNYILEVWTAEHLDHIDQLFLKHFPEDARRQLGTRTETMMKCMRSYSKEVVIYARTMRVKTSDPALNSVLNLLTAKLRMFLHDYTQELPPLPLMTKSVILALNAQLEALDSALTQVRSKLSQFVP